MKYVTRGEKFFIHPLLILISHEKILVTIDYLLNNILFFMNVKKGFLIFIHDGFLKINE